MIDFEPESKRESIAELDATMARVANAVATMTGEEHAYVVNRIGTYARKLLRLGTPMASAALMVEGYAAGWVEAALTQPHNKSISQVDNLTAYVRLELAGQDAAATYPDLAFAVKTSIEVAEAYRVELRKQTRDLVIERLNDS